MSIAVRPEEDAATRAPPGTALASEPISCEQRRELTEANQRARRVRRAAAIATCNGWILGVFAALSLPFSLFSLTALVMCCALAFVACREFQGRKLLSRFEPSGARALGWNQLVLMGVLIAYSVWNIYLAESAPSIYAEQIAATPELQSMLGPIEDLQKTVTMAVYGGLIVASVIFQSLIARYYFAVEKHLSSFLSETAAWVVDLQRSAG